MLNFWGVQDTEAIIVKGHNHFSYKSGGRIVAELKKLLLLQKNFNILSLKHKRGLPKVLFKIDSFCLFSPSVNSMLIYVYFHITKSVYNQKYTFD